MNQPPPHPQTAPVPRWWVLCAALAVLGPVPAISVGQTQQPGSHRIMVANHASSPIVSVLATSGKVWGANLLEAAEVKPGDTTVVAIEGGPTDCAYSLKATLASGKSLISSNVDVCATPTWTVVDVVQQVAHMHMAHPLPLPDSAPAPAPTPAPAPAPTPAPSTPASGAVPSAPPPTAPQPAGPPAAQPGMSAADAEAQAAAHAPLGHALYTIPPKMDLKRAYTATATVYAPAATGVPGAAHSLKVSTYMIVTLTEPDNPGAFTIEPQQSACQFIPEGGFAQWNYKVTPVDLGASHGLSLRVQDTFLFTSYMVYGTDANACSPDNVHRRQFPSDSETVVVSATNVWARAVNFVADNPGKCIGVLLGGGFGIPGLVAGAKWLFARLRRRKQPEPPGGTSPRPSGAGA